MYQLLKFDTPIPSCEIHSLEYLDGNWKYIYALNTPFELTDENTESLIIYEYISDLHLKTKDSVHPESINLEIKTLTEYLAWLEKQRLTDILYREDWKKKHPNAKANIIELENKNYSKNDLREIGVHYIATELDKNEKVTNFAAV